MQMCEDLEDEESLALLFVIFKQSERVAAAFGAQPRQLSLCTNHPYTLQPACPCRYTVAVASAAARPPAACRRSCAAERDGAV